MIVSIDVFKCIKTISEIGRVRFTSSIVKEYKDYIPIIDDYYKFLTKDEILENLKSVRSIMGFTTFYIHDMDLNDIYKLSSYILCNKTAVTLSYFWYMVCGQSRAFINAFGYRNDHGVSDAINLHEELRLFLGK